MNTGEELARLPSLPSTKRTNDPRCEPLKMLLASGEQRLIHAVQNALSCHAHVTLIVSDFSHCTEAALKSHRADVVVIDDDDAHMDTEALVTRVLKLASDQKPIVCGRFVSVDHLRAVARRGVATCIGRDSLIRGILPRADFDRVLELIPIGEDLLVRLLDGAGASAPRHRPASPGEGDPGTRLTERERQLLRLGAAGLIAGDIALSVHLSRHTVNTHFKNIYRKLGVSCRGDAIYQARVLGQL